MKENKQAIINEYINELIKDNRLDSTYHERNGLEILLINTNQKGMAGHFIGKKELDAYIELQKKAAIMIMRYEGKARLYGLIISNGEVEEVLESEQVMQFIETHAWQYPFELTPEEHIGEGRVFNKRVEPEMKELIKKYYKTIHQEEFHEEQEDKLVETIKMLREVEKII